MISPIRTLPRRYLVASTMSSTMRGGLPWAVPMTRRVLPWRAFVVGGERWATPFIDGQRVCSVVEGGTAALGERVGLGRDGLSLSPGDQQVEQDRASAVLTDHDELAWPSL